MDSDSDREKSSDPNELSSSEDKTFHDDGDDSNGSSASDLESDDDDDMTKRSRERIQLKEKTPLLEKANSEPGRAKKKTEGSSRATESDGCGTARKAKIGGNFECGSSDEECFATEKQCSREALEKAPEIDDGVQCPAAKHDNSLCNMLVTASQLVEPNNDVQFADLPQKSEFSDTVIIALVNKSDELNFIEHTDETCVEKCCGLEEKSPSAAADEENLFENVTERLVTKPQPGPHELDDKFRSIVTDDEHLCESARESTECFYSAQDLLEFGHLLTNELKPYDIESGYFEKSESDISRDENEATTSTRINPRSVPKPRSKQSTSVSDGLRVELNRFKAMIESIERERLNNNDQMGRQNTIENVLTAEKNYNDNVNVNVNILADNANGLDHQANPNQVQRGYWSTVFGQASQIESGEELTLDERFADIKKAHRALELLEDYHSRLSEPQDRALRIAIERVIRIFKSRLFQALLARDFVQAYRHQAQCIQAVVKMLQQLKEENWCLPVMYTVCLDLRILAQKCEEQGNSSKPGEILEKAADCLMSCFRVCAADNRSGDEDTKRLGMLNLVNQLFKVYFRINKLHLCKPLIRAIDSSAFKDSFPLPEQITYKYFVGRKAMFDSDYKSADEFLSFALKNCPRNFPRNKRLILIYLVPVKMLLGYMPKKQILERFDVLQFHELAVALKEGNVRKFDEVIQRHEAFFIKCGIYLLVEKLKFIVYRNLFKKVYLIKQTHQLDLSAFRAALQFVGETDMSIDETHCIVANLIFEGKIKGYISYSHNKLVVSKQNPFPPLNTVS